MLLPFRHLFFFALLLPLTGCDNRPQQGPAQLPPPAVTVMPVFKAPVMNSISFLGLTKAVEEVELMARVEGFLAERRFTEGNDVNKGDLLFVIDPEPYRAELDKALAEDKKPLPKSRCSKRNYVKRNWTSATLKSARRSKGATAVPNTALAI